MNRGFKLGFQFRRCDRNCCSSLRCLSLPACLLTEVAEVIKTLAAEACKDELSDLDLREQRDPFFLSGRPGPHSCQGSRISPMFVSHRSLDMAAIVSHCSASTLRPQEQIQDSLGRSVHAECTAHALHASVRPVGAARIESCRSNMSPSQIVNI